MGGAEYPTVYKKNTETLLKYSLPTYKKDDSCDILELDEENTEEIVIQAFDFLIDGISGFAITSNDDRLGAILYCTTNDAINRQQLKAKSILKINNKMNDIKREWACITTGDVYSVLERAYGVKRDLLTRNIFKDIKNFFSNTRWSSVIEGENQVKGLLNYFSEDDVLDALYKRADVGGDCDSRYAARFRSAIAELANSYFSSDNGNSVYNFSGAFEKNAKIAFDEADSIKDSIVKDYHPYRGVVVRKDDDNDIDVSTFLFPIDVMLINEYPVISYSYIDAYGDKKTIKNVWQYIKTLDRDSPMPSVAKRILQHIKYLILDHDGSWANLFHDVYKTFDNIDSNKKRVAQYIKDRYGANGKNKYMYTDLNYGNINQGSHINYVYENTLSRFGYKFVYEVEEGDKYSTASGSDSDKYYKPMRLNKDDDSYDRIVDMVSRVAPIIDQGGIVIGNETPQGAVYGYKYSYQRGVKQVLGFKKRKTRIYVSYLVSPVGVYKYAFGQLVPMYQSYKETSNTNIFGLFDRLNYYKINGADVGIVRDWSKNASSISLPLKSRDGKTLIDVINTKDNRFDLCYEDEVFEPSKTKYAKNDSSGSQSDSNTTVTKAKKNDNGGNLTFIPNPDSTDSLGKQLKDSNHGKQSITSNGSGGQRISLSKDGTVSDYNTGNSTGTGIGLKKGALCKKPRLKI